MEDQPVNGEPVHLSPETLQQVSAELQAYVDKLKETEDNDVIDMVVLNIRMENFRRTMAMSGAPQPLVDEYLNAIMKTALDMIGHHIKVEEKGGAERYIALRQDIINKGEEISLRLASRGG